jgi:hypothetical protein
LSNCNILFRFECTLFINCTIVESTIEVRSFAYLKHLGIETYAMAIPSGKTVLTNMQLTPPFMKLSPSVYIITGSSKPRVRALFIHQYNFYEKVAICIYSQYCWQSGSLQLDHPHSLGHRLCSSGLGCR